MNRVGKIKTLAISALAAVALATPIAIAQTGDGDQGQQKSHRGEGRGHRGGRGGGHFGGREFAGLNLTDEQKTRLQQLHQGFRERTRGLREQLRAKHHEVRQAGEGGTFNEALATQRLTEAAALQAKLMGEEFRLRQESLSVLTPEQRTQLEQRRAERKARRGGRGGRGQGQQL
ncbi:MAG TPA: Spy/CpxP family protein refolding chaperone [Pyrinomonadaceae bacterium]|jgi:protein CpxP|nr:Spy/CpxP family protein refolding chaperone [Pyrinomonadaceae bacterium]